MRTERAVYHILAALLFAALCAWCAAALYERLERTSPPETPAESAVSPQGARFRGVLAREEERVEAGAFPGAVPGARLAANETGGESALWFPSSDGLEGLAPLDLEKLTPEELETLLNSSPGERLDTPRLVYGFTLACAALLDGDASPAPGPCRLVIGGAEAKGRLLSVTTDALGRRLLLLRLTEFPEALYNERFVEGEILE